MSLADRTHIIECSCVGRCGFLVFDGWDVGGDEDEWYAEFYERPGPGWWRWRFRKACALLLGRDVSLGHSVVLDPAQIKAFRDFLSETYPDV